MTKKLLLILLFCSVVFAEEKPYRIINSFNGGELSPLLSAREDISKYQSGCSLLENMITLPQGGIQKRPGTQYIATVFDANYPTKLIPFNYSTGISYVIEAGEDYMRFFRDGTLVLGTGTTPYNLATNYDSSEAFDAQFTQSADVMYFSEPNHFPQKLSRHDNNDWTIESIPITTGPFMAENITDTTVWLDSVSPNNVTGSQIYSASSGTSTASQAFNDSSNADGEGWITAVGNVANQYIQVNFSSPVTVKKIRIQPCWNKTTSTYDVRHCRIDGKANLNDQWTKIPVTSWSGRCSVYEVNEIEIEQIANYTDWAEVEVNNIADYNYMRVYCYDNWGSLTRTALKEVEMFESDVNMIASADIFDPNHVGSLWKLRHHRNDKAITGVLDANESSDNLTIKKRQVKRTTGGSSVVFKKSAGSLSQSMSIGEDVEFQFTTHGTWEGTVALEKSTDDGVTWQTVVKKHSKEDTNIDFEGTEDEKGDVLYRVTMTDWVAAATNACTYALNVMDYYNEGIVRVLSYVDANEVGVEIIRDVNDTNATTKWSEGEWSTYRGFPRTVTFFEDRLLFGGNNNKPDTIWGSVTGDYENFKQGADDDDSISFTLASRQLNEIKWMSGQKTLLIGTSGAEWTVGGSEDNPLTPSNVRAKQQSAYGSADLPAIYANDTVLFFQRNAKKIREMAYNWELDSYISPDMTILNKEITGDGIVNAAFQQIPDSLLWCVIADGNLATFAYERKEQITAWSKQITDGLFESVAVIHGSPEDEVWVETKRSINSANVRYIERFKPREFAEANDAYYVDCGKTYTTDVNVITTLNHLNSESVFILADANIVEANDVTHTLKSVSGNSVTLGRVSQKVHVGLPYTVQMKTMPLSWIAQGTTVQGRIKRINEVIARWYRSGDFSIGKDSTHKEAYLITGQTTDEDRKTFPPGYDRSGYVYVYQYSPEPFTLLALMMEFQVY
jgi:hypothetical protein